MTQLDNAFLDRFQLLDATPKNPRGSPVAQKLSYLLRSSFVADTDKTFVWGDWAAIEARKLPWLAGSAGGEEQLAIFRESDADPKKPDVYIRTAAKLVKDGPLYGLSAEDIWAAYKDRKHELHKLADDLRQSRGKVPVLSLGFGGSIGALIAMAANYRVYLDEKTAQEVVDDWRATNPWAGEFWKALWEAVLCALDRPDTIYTAGRCAYVYDRSYMGGTLFCALPSGRLLTYPAIRWKKVKKVKIVNGKKTETESTQLTFLKAYGQSSLWYGKCAENVTQASAADILRRTLKRLEYDWHPIDATTRRRYSDWMPVVGHTHDEILTETWQDEANVREVRKALLETMERNDDWDEGLPLKAEITSNWYYTKAKV